MQAGVLAGYEVVEAECGEEALQKLQENPDTKLCLLDIMLPDIDGFEVCRRIRMSNAQVGIIMLTARDDVEDKVAGLDLGADDYITKPFAMEELLARIRNALRKHTAVKSEPPIEECLRVKDLAMYPRRYEVEVGGEPVHLTKKEYSLLEYLLRNKRTVLTRDQILQEVWGYDYSGDTNSWMSISVTCAPSLTIISMRSSSTPSGA